MTTGRINQISIEIFVVCVVILCGCEGLWSLPFSLEPNVNSCEARQWKKRQRPAVNHENVGLKH
jgi:hypothetical protein